MLKMAFLCDSVLGQLSKKTYSDLYHEVPSAVISELQKNYWIFFSFAGGVVLFCISQVLITVC